MKFFAVIALVALVSIGCSKKCDPDDLSTWDASCFAGGGGGGGGNGNGGGNGTPITYNNTDTTKSLPSEVTIEGTLEGAHVSLTSNGAWFTANVPVVHFTPVITGVQVLLSRAASFTLEAPSPNGCALTNQFGYAGVANNGVSILKENSDACRELLTNMTNGYAVTFTNVPTNTGGTIATVHYYVRP